MTQQHRQSAFSLVELSVVLVIIGLLVGGVVAGRSLIRAAELRNITVEADQFRRAVETFRDMYNALPGDMPNAEEIWGTNCTLSGASAAPSACNGNGDGKIYPWVFSPDYPTCGGGTKSGVNNEAYQFWKQMANANLITGRFIGLEFGGGNELNGMIRNPVSHAGEDLVWKIYDIHPCDTRTWRQPNQGGGLILSSINHSGQSSFEVSRALSVEDVWSIDNKMDDGRPGTGGMRSLLWADAGLGDDDDGTSVRAWCTTTKNESDVAEAEYNIGADPDDELVGCVPYFLNVY